MSSTPLPLRILAGRIPSCLFAIALGWAAGGLRANEFLEAGGLVVMEVESAPVAPGWASETSISGFLGSAYYRATSSSSGSGGNGLLEYPVAITNAGEYQLQWRSRIAAGNDQTEANDTFVRLVDANGNPVTPIANNLTPTGTWYKIYMNTVGSWHWQASNRDHDPKAVAWNLAAGARYTLQVSYRSANHAIDRILLWNRTGGFGHSFGTSSGTPINSNQANALPESTTGDPPPPPPEDDGDGTVTVSGQLKQWHKVTVDLAGPWRSETGDPNPFLDHRMTVTFTQGGDSYTVPGYFAADGDAAETSATTGTVWRAHFAPPTTGQWNYEIDFRSGADAALGGGTETAPFDGATGSFPVAGSDKSGKDFRAGNRGKLVYSGETFLAWAGGAGPFVKAGCNSPEVFLEFADFDNTNSSRSYPVHVSDWENGDPVWKGSRGKGLIGVVNYLSGLGMNGHYFLTMNAYGDGQRAWPWTGPDNFEQYDVSKLAQWQIVFDHMMRRGVMPQFVLTEQENQSYFEFAQGGTFADGRKLYYREMVARFGYLNAVTWNIGEESGWQRTDTGRGLAVTDAQRQAFAAYLRGLLPYEDAIIVHNGPSNTDAIFTPLVGDPSYSGISYQGNYQNSSQGHGRIVHWWNQSTATSQPWVLFYDEPYSNSDFPNLDTWRKNSLWAAFSGGASGVGYYAGGGKDLQIQDYTAYDDYWNTMVLAKGFMESLPGTLTDYVPSDGLVTNGWCLADPGTGYFIYLPSGGTTTLDLSGQSGDFNVLWFNPRGGDTLEIGSVASVAGGGQVALGSAPSDTGNDWAVLVRKAPRIAYIHGDVAADGTVPSGAATPYDQMLLTDSGNEGLSFFKAMVENEGFEIDQHYDQTTTLDAAFLAPYDVIVFGLHQKIWSGVEKEALDTWLREGGGMLIYSDSASGGQFNIVGPQNPVGQTVVNNLIAGYGMEVTVDQADGIKAYRAGPGADHPIVTGRPILEGEGVSPVAVDPASGAVRLIPYDDNSDFRVSGSPDIFYQQNLTITNPSFAALALRNVEAGKIIAMFDRQPMWNNGPGSDIERRDNEEILRRTVRYLAGLNFAVPAPPVVQVQETFGNGGSPWAIGGAGTTRIEAENFDLGGSDVAYRDTTTGNEGDSNYRNDEDVDLQGSSGTEDGGINVGWIADNEWWEFTVEIEAGVYDLHARVASDKNSPGNLDWVLDGTPLSGDGTQLGTMDIADTGGWQVWETLRLESVALPAGVHVLRLESDGGDYNLNWIELSPAAPPARAYDQAYIDLLFASDPRGTTGPHTAFDAVANGFLANGLIYALGIDSLDPAAAIGKVPFVEVVEDNGQHFLEFSFRRPAGGTGPAAGGYTADGVVFTVEYTKSLPSAGWQVSAASFSETGASVDNGDGTETVTVRFDEPVETNSENRLVLRLRVVQAGT